MIITVPFAEPQHEKPYDFRRYSLFGLRQELEKNGFLIRDIGMLQDFKTSIRYLKIWKASERFLGNQNIWNRVTMHITILLNNLYCFKQMQKGFIPDIKSDFSCELFCICEKI